MSEYSNKQIGADFNSEHFLTREAPNLRIVSITQDFSPRQTGETYDGITDVEPVSRGFAYALFFGFMFWSFVGLIYLFVKSL